MAVYYLSSVNGDDTTADGSKSLPYATLGAIPFTNGDLILVDSVHSSAENIAAPDATVGAPIQIISVDWTTGTGAADESYLAGAAFVKGGGITCRGAVAAYGVKLQQTSTSYWCDFGKDVHSDIYLYDCTVLPGPATNLELSGPSGTAFYANHIRFDKCSVWLSASTKIVCRWGAQAAFRDCAITSDPGTDGVILPQEGFLNIDGLDLSTLTSGALLDLSYNGRVVIRNAPLPTGVSLISSGGISSAFLAGGELFYLSPSGSLDVVRVEGQASTSGAVYRNGGATLSDGSAISFACITTANAVSGVKSLEVLLDRRILDLSTTKSVRAYIAQDGGTALTNQDIWLEVIYRRPSDGIGKLVSSRPVAPHLSGTTLQTDTTSTWVGLTSPVLQYVEVQVPSDVAGDAHAEIILHVSSPSTTVYVDPAVEVA